MRIICQQAFTESLWKKGVVEAGVREVRASDARVAEVSVREVGVLEVSVSEIGQQPRVAQLRTCEERVGKPARESHAVNAGVVEVEEGC